MQIDIRCEWHTDYAWTCSCGKENLELEGQLNLDDGDYVFCSACNKTYNMDKKALKLSEELENTESQNISMRKMSNR